ncbi:MAG: UDP-N-acetylglucosamine pyrophosphorylase [Alyxoria varia]|nr:MAG: UDP-N-acetylglucosamine pyrophosphorylase [Alyxoria varia]
MAGVVNHLLEKLNLSKTSGEPAKPPDPQDLKELREKYTQAKQDHVFHYYDGLPDSGKASLYEQLVPIDPRHVNELAEKTLKPAKPEDESKEPPKLDPLPDSASASVMDSKKEDLAKWHDHGMELVSENKVGVVLMAGGQGTRLGSSAPKGCYNIGLPSAKSLFQLQAERIVKLQELAAKQSKHEEVVIPWYVMTSGPTKQPTQDFFEKHNYFGLSKQNVLIFEQGILPCISNEGKIIMESKDKVAVAPDGNGGLYQAMVVGSVISDMHKRGIEHIHAYCVDNCLVKMADPTFIGFAASKEVDIATKVVRKRNAKESVGLILQKNGKPDVVEYSEIDNATAEAKDSKSPELLKFRAANIVNHYYSFSFLENIPTWAGKLPHHLARKKIPFINLENDQIVKPDKPNGVKLEQFVFDCFPFLPMDKFACLEVKREDEFSPLKNAKGTGEDDPDTSRNHILDQGRRWLETAGAVVVSETDQTGVEVSPLISYEGEGLAFLSAKQIHAPAVVEKEEKQNK